MSEPYYISEARRRMSAARQDLQKLQQESKAAVTDAQNFTDPGLNPQGLATRRHELREAARERFEPRIRQLREQVAQDTKTTGLWLEESRPTIADDPAALMRAQTKWDQSRTQLEAGASMRELIASADEDTLLAIREWAPSHITAEARKTHPGGLMAGPFERPEDAIGTALSAVDARLAEVSEGDFADAHKVAQDARAEAAYVGPLLQHTYAEVSGSPTDGMRAAIDATFAMQAVQGEGRALEMAEADAGGQDSGDAA